MSSIYGYQGVPVYPSYKSGHTCTCIAVWSIMVTVVVIVAVVLVVVFLDPNLLSSSSSSPSIPTTPSPAVSSSSGSRQSQEVGGMPSPTSSLTIGTSQVISSSSISTTSGAASQMIIALGQSNSQGEGCCYNPSLDYGYGNMYQYVIDDGYSDTAYTTGISAVAHTLTHAQEPLYDGGSNRANIIGNLVALGRDYINATNMTGSLILVQAAVSGTTIEQWIPPTGGLMARALQASNQAAYLAANSTVAMFVYVQMEGDAEYGTSATSFLSQLVTFINISRNGTIGAGPTTPFIVGSAVPEWITGYGASAVALMNVLRSVPSLIPYTAYADHPWGYVDCYESIHYSATGQRMTGALMLKGYRRALNNSKPSLIPNHPIGTALSPAGDAVQVTWTAVSGPLTGYVLVYHSYTNLNNPGGSCADGNAAPPTEMWTHSLATVAILPLSPSSGFQVQVYAANGIQLSSGSANSWVIVQPATPILWYAGGTGGNTYTDTFGSLWSYNATSVCCGGIASSSASPTNTANPTLYLTYAFTAATLVFTVSPFTNYTVILMFAEPSCQTSNCRVFTITVNGSPCVSNFDLYATAGYDTAYNVLCPFNISGTSTVTIQLINIAQTAILNALQILPLGTVNNYTTVNQAPTPSPIQWYASGGATYKDTFGATWSYAVEFIYNGQLTSSSSSIANTANPTLYQYAVLTGGVMPIEFAVLSSATYSVTLMFAETVCQHANCRVGNYSVNGVMCLSNFDIWATVGLNAAYNYVCPQTVTGATTITIDVTTVVALAYISAIQLLPVGVTNNYTKAVSAAPILWYASTSPAYVDTFGQTWNYYTSASIVGATGTYSSSTVANTANQGLYQSYIYATNSGGTMTLLYDVNSATSYRIMLLFAEFVCTQAGCRVGTYDINGTPCVNSFDIYGVAGAATAFNILCPQIISGVGQILVEVTSISGSAQLNAVEILPVGVQNNYTANALSP